VAIMKLGFAIGGKLCGTQRLRKLLYGGAPISTNGQWRARLAPRGDKGRHGKF